MLTQCIEIVVKVMVLLTKRTTRTAITCLSEIGSICFLLRDLDNCEFIGNCFDHKDPVSNFEEVWLIALIVLIVLID